MLNERQISIYIFRNIWSIGNKKRKKKPTEKRREREREKYLGNERKV
jgi:hypothetical protein